MRLSLRRFRRGWFAIVTSFISWCSVSMVRKHLTWTDHQLSTSPPPIAAIPVALPALLTRTSILPTFSATSFHKDSTDANLAISATIEVTSVCGLIALIFSTAVSSKSGLRPVMVTVLAPAWAKAFAVAWKSVRQISTPLSKSLYQDTYKSNARSSATNQDILAGDCHVGPVNCYGRVDIMGDCLCQLIVCVPVHCGGNSGGMD